VGRGKKNSKNSDSNRGRRQRFDYRYQRLNTINAVFGVLKSEEVKI